MEPATGAFMLLMTIGEMQKEVDQNELIAYQGSIINQQQEQILEQKDMIQDLDTKLIMLNAYIIQVEEQTALLQEQIKSLNTTLTTLAASHSSVSARDKVNIERLEDNAEFLNTYIERVEGKTNYLEKLMSIHHP